MIWSAAMRLYRVCCHTQLSIYFCTISFVCCCVVVFHQRTIVHASSKLLVCYKITIQREGGLIVAKADGCDVIVSILNRAIRVGSI